MNHAISCKILAREGRFPWTRIFYSTLNTWRFSNSSFRHDQHLLTHHSDTVLTIVSHSIDQDLFWTKIIFKAQNSHPKNSFSPKFFLTQNFFGPNIFWPIICFGPHIFLGPNIHFGPKFFWIKNFFGTKFFCTHTLFFEPKILFRTKFFFSSQIFLD